MGYIREFLHFGLLKRLSQFVLDLSQYKIEAGGNANSFSSHLVWHFWNDDDAKSLIV